MQSGAFSFNQLYFTIPTYVRNGYYLKLVDMHQKQKQQTDKIAKSTKNKSFRKPKVRR